MPLELVIYDCDGTLLDTETIYADVALAECRRLGLDWSVDDYVRHMAGIPLADGLAAIEAALGRRLPAELESEIEDEVAARLAPDTGLMPGVRAALTAVGGRRCVASSTSLDPLRRNLSLVGLAEMFEPHVFSASQIARGKPFPDVFLFAAAQMAAEPANCVVLEDSVAGVRAGIAAGMRVAGFIGASHDPETARVALLEAGAVLVIDRFEQWPAAVEALRAA